MAFTGRSRATIRDSILATWSAEYTSIGLRLLIAPGSDAYLQASAFAVLMEGLEAQAESVERDILPDQASPEALARHGEVDGVARGVGVRARHTVAVTGPVATTITFATGVTYQMVYSDGTTYDVDSAAVTLSGGTPAGTLEVLAVDIGADPTRTDGDTLTFVAAPTGLNSTGTVADTVPGTPLVTGTDLESISDWAQRIIENRQERPASGNRADWRAWVRAYTGTDIDTAYVYPLLEPPASFPGTGVANTLGCVTAVAVGLAQGDSVTNTRIVPYTGTTRDPGVQLPKIMGYIEGTHNAAGVETSTGTMLRPVTMQAANASVESINISSQNVVLSCTMNTANAFPWVGGIALTASTVNTVEVAGDYTSLNGLSALLLIGTTYVRGGDKQYTLPTGVYNGGTNRTTWTFSTAFAAAPTGTMYPCPANWPTIRTNVFAHFDALGPGDTTPASRWPTEATGARATLYRTGLAADVINGTPTTTTTREAATSTTAATVTTVTSIAETGVLSCTVTTPAADVTPAAKTVVTLGTLLVTP